MLNMWYNYKIIGNNRDFIIHMKISRWENRFYLFKIYMYYTTLSRKLIILLNLVILSCLLFLTWEVLPMGLLLSLDMFLFFFFINQNKNFNMVFKSIHRSPLLLHKIIFAYKINKYQNQSIQYCKFNIVTFSDILGN